MGETQAIERQSLACRCLSELGWLAAGFMMPCASLTFYRRAARRRVIGAIFFFFLFALVTTKLSTIKVGVALFPIYRDIRQAFESGEFPEITIRNGVATVEADQPFVVYDDEGTIIVLDTTGVYEELDRSRYRQGLLLTRTSLHVMNNDGRYQVIPLRDLQDMFNADPMVIDADSATGFWVSLSAVLTVLAFVFIGIWNMLVRLVYVTMLGLVIWGIAALIRRGTSFAPVLVTGLYATIPAVYAHYLLGLLDLRFIFLYTILFLPMWAIALVVALAGSDFGFIGGERPLRGWRTLIGVPVLLVFALDAVIEFPKRALVIWPLALLTFVVLMVVGLMTARKPRQPEMLEGPEVPGEPEPPDQLEAPESV
jgi:hypothetical protein